LDLLRDEVVEAIDDGLLLMPNAVAGEDKEKAAD